MAVHTQKTGARDWLGWIRNVQFYQQACPRAVNPSSGWHWKPRPRLQMWGNTHSITYTPKNLFAKALSFFCDWRSQKDTQKVSVNSWNLWTWIKRNKSFLVFYELTNQRAFHIFYLNFRRFKKLRYTTCNKMILVLRMSNKMHWWTTLSPLLRQWQAQFLVSPVSTWLRTSPHSQWEDRSGK